MQEGKVSTQPVAVTSKYFCRATAGFDLNAGKTWIYPTNYPIREYQLNICQKCLFRNTIVILPTGLGKTFIAAVVMMNFYRWYPKGKVVFMAPTKPLVAQQIQACVTIVAIPQNDSIQMTGAILPEERKKLWKGKRVFFLTPQVLVNDMASRAFDPTDIKCLIVDEAHKAMGNSAYSQAVKELSEHSTQFRILALTATPGNDRVTLQQVLDNLRISHIEIRFEDSLDIQPYTHARKIEKVVVPIGEETQAVKNIFLKSFHPVAHALASMKVLSFTDLDALSSYIILRKREEFRARHKGNTDPRVRIIEHHFAMCASFCHAMELLRHGIRPFYNYLKEIMLGLKSVGGTKNELMKNQELMQLYKDLGEKFEGEPQVDTGPLIYFGQVLQTQASQPVCKKPTNIGGNPKLSKLLEIVEEHFRKYEANGKVGQTRVMIFSQFRDSVHEITCAMNCCRPLVRATSFVGQQQGGSSIKGQNQKEQIQVVKAFRGGEFNTLVSTCIGEEGLDIGEVDLIICYDAVMSPIRLVQRMGRTGRKRDGRIICLVTSGREEQVYKKGLMRQRSIAHSVTKWVSQCKFYEHSPRMVPDEVEPACVQQYVTPVVFEKQDSAKKSIRNYFKKDESPYLDNVRARAWEKLLKIKDCKLKSLPAPSMRCMGQISKPDQNNFDLSNWLPWQTTEQNTFQVGHSSLTRAFVKTMAHFESQEGLDEDSNLYWDDLAPFFVKDDVLLPGMVENTSKSTIRDYFKHAHVPQVEPIIKPQDPDLIHLDLSEDEDFARYPKRTSPIFTPKSHDPGKLPNFSKDDSNSIEVGDSEKEVVLDSLERNSTPPSEFAELFILATNAFKEICIWKGPLRESPVEKTDIQGIPDSNEEEFFSVFDPSRVQKIKDTFRQKIHDDADPVKNPYRTSPISKKRKSLAVEEEEVDYFNSDEDDAAFWLTPMEIPVDAIADKSSSFLHASEPERPSEVKNPIEVLDSNVAVPSSSKQMPNEQLSQEEFFEDDWDDPELEILLGNHMDRIETSEPKNDNVTGKSNLVLKSPTVQMAQVDSSFTKGESSHLMRKRKSYIKERQKMPRIPGSKGCEQRETKAEFKLEITLDDIDSGSSLISASPSPPRKKFVLPSQVVNKSNAVPIANAPPKVDDVFQDEIIIDSDDEEDLTPVVQNFAVPGPSKCVNGARASSKKSGAQFLELEANCEEEENGSSEIHDNALDEYEESFVDDRMEFTQVPKEDMKAVYLKSIRSPFRPQGVKLVPAKPRETNIYSQVEQMEVEHYIPDSFCVGSDETSAEDVPCPRQKKEKRKRKRIRTQSSSKDELNRTVNPRHGGSRPRPESGEWITRQHTGGKATR